jgi:hypothetical protein
MNTFVLSLFYFLSKCLSFYIDLRRCKLSDFIVFENSLLNLKNKMMVKNSINIIKTNNHFSPTIIGGIKTVTYAVGNPSPGLGQMQKMCRS